MKTTGDRYIGGGKLFFTPNKAAAVRVEIGEIQECTLSMSVETKDAFSKDTVMKKLVEKVATAINASLKFTTQIRNKNNTAMAMLGSELTKTFEIGDTLPNGTVATAQVAIPYIKAGTDPIIEGKLEFVGDEDGAKQAVLVVHNAVITPTGDVSYISEDFSVLSFEGAVLETADGLVDEYEITVGA